MNQEKLEQVERLFKSKGLNYIMGDMYKQQEKWFNWYRADINDFHYYSIKTINGVTAQKQKPTLNMGKKVCEDWSSLLWNEKTEIVTENENIKNVLKANHFSKEISAFIETTFAIGTGAIIEYIADGKTKLTFLYGDAIIPISYSNTTIEDISVIQEFTIGKKDYTHIQYHTFKDGIYRVTHEMYEGKKLDEQISLDVLFSEDEIKNMTHFDEEGNPIFYIEYKTEAPHYQIFKPQITNNFEIGNPLGMSILGNSISTLECIDDKYYSFREDDKNSRKRIFASDEGTRTQLTTTTDKDGELTQRTVRYFDQDDTTIQTALLPEDDPLRFYTPEYHSEPHISGIEFELNILSAKVGLGTGYYSFDPTKGVTATEVIHRNSDTWRNRQKHINALKENIIAMAKAILFLETELNNYNGEDVEIDVKFDDSIIVDDNKRLDDMKKDAEDGIIPKWRYVMGKYKLSEEEAKKWIDDAQVEQAERQAKFIAQYNE